MRPLSSVYVCRYCVGIHRRVDVYSIESAGVEYTVDLKCRPNSLVFVDDNTIAVGCESSKIQVLFSFFAEVPRILFRL